MKPRCMHWWNWDLCTSCGASKSAIQSEILRRGFHVTQELLGDSDEFDRNRRFLRYGEQELTVFNRERAPWSADQEKAVQRACDELNMAIGLEPWPR